MQIRRNKDKFEPQTYPVYWMPVSLSPDNWEILTSASISRFSQSLMRTVPFSYRLILSSSVVSSSSILLIISFNSDMRSSYFFMRCHLRNRGVSYTVSKKHPDGIFLLNRRNASDNLFSLPYNAITPGEEILWIHMGQQDTDG